MSCKQQVDKLIRRRGGLQIAIALAILSASATVANASNLYWNSTSGDWSTSDWTTSGGPHSPPTSSDVAYVGDNGVVTVTLNPEVCATLYVGHNLTKPGTGTVNISTGYLTVGSGSGTMYIGTLGYGGTVTQSGGGATVGGLVFGATSGTYNLNGGVLSVGSGGITPSGAATFNLGSGTLQASASFSSAINMATSGAPIINTQAYAVALSGNLSGTGAVTKNGGGTLTLSGTNGYTGDTTVSAGTLAFGADNVVPNGSGTGNVAVNTGATLDLAGYNATINGLNNGAGGGGTVDSTVAGTPTLTVGGNNATSTFSGMIQNTAGTLSLTKIGAGRRDPRWRQHLCRQHNCQRRYVGLWRQQRHPQRLRQGQCGG